MTHKQQKNETNKQETLTQQCPEIRVCDQAREQRFHCGSVRKGNVETLTVDIPVCLNFLNSQQEKGSFLVCGMFSRSWSA